jgi:hypothetical protein
VPTKIILLPRDEIEALTPFGDHVEAVANAFCCHAEGQATSPTPLHIPAEGVLRQLAHRHSGRGRHRACL